MDEIKRINASLQSESVMNELNQFEADEYIQLLNNNFLGVQMRQSDLVCDQTVSESDKDQAKAEYTEIEKLYISLKAKLRNRSVNVLSAVSTSVAAQAQPQIKIDWKNFSGNYHEWKPFFVNFNKAVNESEMFDDAAKFNLLLKSTDGQAHALIEKCNTFAKAWKMLKIFYGNKFRQSHAVLSKLSKIEAIKKRSSGAFSLLIEQLDGYIAILKDALGTDDFTSTIPLLVIDKMDEITNNLWYVHYAEEAQKWADKQANTKEATDYIPNWPSTRAFLVAQMQNLKRTENMRHQSVPQMRPSDMRAGCSSQMRPNETNFRSVQQMREIGNETGTKPKEYCTKCGAFHRLYKCEVFKAMSLARRWAHVSQANLCPRCLHPQHLGQCKDAKNNDQCETCKKYTVEPAYHNSTLCKHVARY